MNVWKKETHKELRAERRGEKKKDCHKAVQAARQASEEREERDETSSWSCTCSQMSSEKLILLVFAQYFPHLMKRMSLSEWHSQVFLN